jgi:hypothetical protein
LGGIAKDRIPSVEEEKRTPSLSESLENSGEIVAESPTLKTLIAAIGAGFDAAVSGSPAPFGTALSTWVVARADEIEKRRIEEQFVLLLQQLQTLEGQVVRRDFFETEEGRDMLIKALDEARRTRSRLKKELYALILKGAILDVEKREYSSEEYLYLISDLTEQEIQVALSIYEEHPPPKEEAWKAWAEKVGSQVGMDVADLRFALGRIVSSGLLDRVGLVNDEVGDGFYEPEEDEVGLYRVTPGFKKLMRFMEREG